MSRYQYEPRVGVPPIRFGMSRAEVHEQIGQPKETLSFSAAGSSDTLLNNVIENSGARGLKEELERSYKAQMTDIYNDGDLSNGPGPSAYAYISEVTYVDGTVSQVTSLDPRDEIYLDDIDLTADDLRGTLEALYQKSSEVFYESTFVYFPELGVKISDDPDAQRAVLLGDGRTEDSMMAGGDYKAISRDEFIEFYGDEGDR